jgi:hypothetical protein
LKSHYRRTEWTAELWKGGGIRNEKTGTSEEWKNGKQDPPINPRKRRGVEDQNISRCVNAGRHFVTYLGHAEDFPMSYAFSYFFALIGGMIIIGMPDYLGQGAISSPHP